MSFGEGDLSVERFYVAQARSIVPSCHLRASVQANVGQIVNKGFKSQKRQTQCKGVRFVWDPVSGGFRWRRGGFNSVLVLGGKNVTG